MNFFKLNKNSNSNKQSLNKANNLNKNSTLEYSNSEPQQSNQFEPSTQQSNQSQPSTQEYTNNKKYNEIVKQNIPRSYPEIKDKYHFFIGNFIKDYVQISILKELKKTLRSQYRIDKDKSYDNFFLCFKINYIGYMTNKEADYYMNNILSYLLNTIKKNIKKLVCHYTKFKLKFVKDHSIRISLEYEDENNLLSNVIIPYINKKGIEPIYDRKIEKSKPSIELIYMEKNDFIPNIYTEINIKVPTETFVIDKLTLIRGGLTKLRSGTPSKHDQLIFNNVKHYSYNFN
jgi:hypothetical protein